MLYLNKYKSTKKLLLGGVGLQKIIFVNSEWGFYW